MRFASLGSGSRGNATLIESGQTCVLLDCGFTLKETVRRLARIGKEPDQLDAILVTHEHSDHISGVGPLARKYGIPVYMTSGTWQQNKVGKIEYLEQISSHDNFVIKGLQVQPIPVPHDAREPCQFILDDGADKLGILTDLGSITPFVRQSYTNLDGLLLECNHDVELLAQGPYPYRLQQRISGDYGHLNNQQAAQLLTEIQIGNLQHLVISHISEQNNSPGHAADAVAEAIDGKPDWLTIADQDNGFGWREFS